MSNFLIICLFFLRFGLANDIVPLFKLEYDSLSPDEVKFNIRSDHNRYIITTAKCDNFVNNSTDGTAKQTVALTDLVPCKLYECTIEIKSHFSLEKIIYILNITTGIGNKTPPIKLLNVTPESNLIRIELEYNQIDCIESFYLVLNSSKVILWTKNNLTRTLTISELPPCSVHHMYIFLYHKSGPYTILSDNVQTTALKPGRIEQIDFNRETDLLSWVQIFYDECPVPKFYVITIKPESRNETMFFETDRNVFKLDFLGERSIFFIQVYPKGFPSLFGTIRLVIGSKTLQSPITNVEVNMINKTTLWIKWNHADAIGITDYLVQVDEVWTGTTSLEHIVPVCDNSRFYNISVCIARLGLADSCVYYNFDVGFNELIAPTHQSATIEYIPELYRLSDWGAITTYNFTHSMIQINKKITLLPNIRITLIISRDNCGSNYVPTFKLFNSNNSVDKCPYVMVNDCTIVCELLEHPQEVRLTVNDRDDSFKCNSPKHDTIALKHGVTYNIMARISTPAGYTDTMPISFQKNSTDDNTLGTIMLISILAASTIAIAIVAVMGFYLKCNRHRPQQQNINIMIRDSTTSDDSIEQTCPIDFHLYKDLINF